LKAPGVAALDVTGFIEIKADELTLTTKNEAATRKRMTTKVAKTVAVLKSKSAEGKKP
jgi:hypothetical protein